MTEDGQTQTVVVKTRNRPDAALSASYQTNRSSPLVFVHRKASWDYYLIISVTVVGLQGRSVQAFVKPALPNDVSQTKSPASKSIDRPPVTSRVETLTKPRQPNALLQP